MDAIVNIVNVKKSIVNVMLWEQDVVNSVNVSVVKISFYSLTILLTLKILMKIKLIIKFKLSKKKKNSVTKLIQLKRKLLIKRLK